MKKIGGILRFLKAVIFVLNYAIATYIVNILNKGGQINGRGKAREKANL